MAKRNDDRDGNRRAAQQLAAWIDGHLGLLRGLADLRDLGPEACEAVAVVLQVRELKTMALSWALWEALTTGSGFDPEAVLTAEIPYSRIDLARRALWGSDPTDLDPAT
jgi:hypothetical protein